MHFWPAPLSLDTMLTFYAAFHQAECRTCTERGRKALRRSIKDQCWSCSKRCSRVAKTAAVSLNSYTEWRPSISVSHTEHSLSCSL